MSEVTKAKWFLENSLLQPLLTQAAITDISFNGERLYYQSSYQGRQLADVMMTVPQAYQFIKQLANYMNVPFTYLDPIVDMSIDRYRIFAVGQAIGRKAYLPTLTFSIRIHPPSGMIHRWFIPPDSGWERLFIKLIQKGYSLVIAGKTGVGKTQFQKELLTLMTPHQRLIIIDNILELDGLRIPHLDLTIWQVTQMAMMGKLIEAALRSNPDWLLIAEARGEEFKEVLRSVKTGHPIITTLHSHQLSSIYERMVSMLLIHEQASMMERFETDVIHAFPVLILLERFEIEGRITRKIAGVQLTKDHRVIRLDETNLEGLLGSVLSWL